MAGSRKRNETQKMIADHSEVFYYFEDKFIELSKKYGFGFFEAEPCSVNSKEDLHYFVQNMMNSLFKGEDTSTPKLDFMLITSEDQLVLC